MARVERNGNGLLHGGGVRQPCRTATDVVRQLARAKEQVARELEENLKQLREVLRETERIANDMEAILQEARTPTACRGEEPEGCGERAGEGRRDDGRARRDGEARPAGGPRANGDLAPGAAHRVQVVCNRVGADGEPPRPTRAWVAAAVVRRREHGRPDPGAAGRTAGNDHPRGAHGEERPRVH